MKLKKLLFITSALLVSSYAMASKIDYDYAQIGYVDYDGATGLNLQLSMDIFEGFYGRVNYTDVEVKNWAADFSSLQLNAGYRLELSKSTDFVTELGYESIDDDLFEYFKEDSGFNALIGIRSAITKEFELGGYIQYSDIMQSTDLILEGRYHFTPELSVGIEFGDHQELESHYGANFRYTF